MEDMQFISQMASFTSLEQMRGLAQNFKEFTTAERLVGAQNYLGRIVTLDVDKTIVTGEVTKVTVVDGKPKLMVAGKTYDLDDVTGITPKPENATAVAPVPGTAPGPGPQLLGTAPTIPVQSNP